MFETARLILRPYRESDRGALLDLWNDALVQRLITVEYTAPRGPKFAERLESWVHSSLFSAIIETKADEEMFPRFVGQCFITAPSSAKNRDADCGLTLRREFWGKGYGSEVMAFLVEHAFQTCGLHRLSLGVFAGNGAALTLYKKIGFVEEGVKRKANWADGHWEDVHLMAILQEEWEARKSQTHIREVTD